MSSKDDLKAAFTGESMASRTYLAFAKKADASVETCHSFNHLSIWAGVELQWTT